MFVSWFWEVEALKLDKMTVSFYLVSISRQVLWRSDHHQGQSWSGMGEGLGNHVSFYLFFPLAFLCLRMRPAVLR